jgi:LysR family transcriptional regulator for bpeEF and oprC
MDRLDALKVFCAVVDTGGFSRAAAKLGISTSSVTHQIGLLETHFGVKLLNRTTRSMSLTDEGRRCIEQARRLLDEMDDLELNLSDSLHEPRGSLRSICRAYWRSATWRRLCRAFSLPILN